jgi:hypothetical protein
MSADPSITAPAEERFNLTRLGVIPLIVLAAGLLALGVSLVWGFFDTKRFAFGWLVSFMFVFTIAGGALFWTLIHHALDCDWSVTVRRLLEQVSALFFPWLALLFLPILLLPGKIYKWWDKNPLEDHLLAHKSLVLNHGFFWGFGIACLAFFGGFAWLMRGLSVRQDASGDPALSIRMRQLAYAGLILFSLMISFAGIMWIMALDYHWFSTMWGVYIFAGSAGSALAAIILISHGLRSAGYLRGVVTVEHDHILGKLLFAFTIFWAYIAFSQYMLYYYANIPEETIFFIQRNEGTWYHLSVFLVFGRFFFPFLLLITQPAKRNPYRICFAAAWILVMHFLDLYWMIIPQYQVNTGVATEARGLEIKFVLDVITVLGMLAVLAFVFLRRLPQTSLFPKRDPRLYESVTLTN